MSTGEGSGTDLATGRGRDWPSVRQFNVFLENRVGGLLSVVRRFEATDIRIVSLIVNDLSDCAIIRLVLSDPERALEVLEQAGLPSTESDLLVVQLPDGPHPLPRICKALLAAEINIDYAYQLLVGSQSLPALALRVDDLETAVNMLREQGYTILTENDLNQ
jgi:hypothetical protein